eukprot:7253322-Prymnesium_polylepis.1
MQYCNTDACGRGALCHESIRPVCATTSATIGTGEALLAQYMSVLLMEMSFSGSSTLFTSVSGESEERTCP